MTRHTDCASESILTSDRIESKSNNLKKPGNFKTHSNQEE